MDLGKFWYEIKMLPLICQFQSAAALRMRTNACILGENKLWKKCVYQRDILSSGTSRPAYLFFTSLLSPAAIVKKYILGTFIHIHLHV